MSSRLTSIGSVYSYLSNGPFSWRTRGSFQSVSRERWSSFLAGGLVLPEMAVRSQSRQAPDCQARSERRPMWVYFICRRMRCRGSHLRQTSASPGLARNLKTAQALDSFWLVKRKMALLMAGPITTTARIRSMDSWGWVRMACCLVSLRKPIHLALTEMTPPFTFRRRRIRRSGPTRQVLLKWVRTLIPRSVFYRGRILSGDGFSP